MDDELVDVDELNMEQEKVVSVCSAPHYHFNAL